MVSRVSHTTVDSQDPYALSLFWSEVLGYAEDPEDPNLPEHDENTIFAPDGSHRILFIRVPEPKAVKNRIHFDLRPVDRTRDEEIERVRALGATAVQDLRQPDGTGWLVMGDPEGNEFCILRSDAEVAAT